MRCILPLLALSLLASPALAQGGNGDPRAACEADYKALCPGVKPGGGRVLQCFKEHKDQVSKECLAALEEARAKRSAQ